MTILNTVSLDSNKKIKLNFNGGDLSSDAGLLLIKEFASKIGFNRLINNLFSLLGPYVAFALPMAVFILTGFMMTIPKEMEEAAVIDGCNKYNMFFRIILPLSKAGLSTLAIYNAVGMWNEFAFANTFLNDIRVKTLPLALGAFKGEHSQDTPLILTVLTLSALPTVVMFIIFQDKLVKGMMAGAVKG